MFHTGRSTKLIPLLWWIDIGRIDAQQGRAKAVDMNHIWEGCCQIVDTTSQADKVTHGVPVHGYFFGPPMHYTVRQQNADDQKGNLDVRRLRRALSVVGSELPTEDSD